MIRHIVQLNLKPEVGAEERAWLFDQVRQMATPSLIKNLQVGKRLAPREPWYAERVTAEYEWLIAIEFENEDDLYAYEMSEVHDFVAAEIRKRMDGPIRIVDFLIE